MDIKNKRYVTSYTDETLIGQQLVTDDDGRELYEFIGEETQGKYYMTQEQVDNYFINL